MVDSGVGGLTVARAVLDQLPHESLHYVGDTANGPYGPKPIAEVRAHALAVMDDLVETGVKRSSSPVTVLAPRACATHGNDTTSR